MSRAPSKWHLSPAWLAPVMVLALVVTVRLWAADPTSGLPTIRTRYYRLHTDLPSAEARDVARFLDEMFVSYARVFRLRAHRQAPLDVYVFRTRERFLAYGERQSLEKVQQYRGFFSAGLRVMASYGSGAELRRILAHEGTHQFITLVTRPTHQPPLWFHEGLATYFETATWDNGNLTLGALNRERLAGLALMRRGDRFVPTIPLRHLLTAEEFTLFHYAEAWSFVYFLLHGDGGRNADVLNRYFILIQEGEDPVEAFARAFRAPLSKVEDAWRAYVNKLLQEFAPRVSVPAHSSEPSGHP